MLILSESWLVRYIKRSDVTVYNPAGSPHVSLMLNIRTFLNKKISWTPFYQIQADYDIECNFRGTWYCTKIVYSVLEVDTEFTNFIILKKRNVTLFNAGWKSHISEVSSFVNCLHNWIIFKRNISIVFRVSSLIIPVMLQRSIYCECHF